MNSPARDEPESCADGALPNQAEDSLSEKQQFNEDLEDFYNEMDNVGYQCEACSSKFMSEHSLRIHAVQCNKSRQLQQGQKSDVSQSGLRRLEITTSKNELIYNFLFIRSDSSLEPGSFEPYDEEDFLNDDSNSSPTKQTPIKSWLKNYMNSEKSPEMSVLKSPAHSQPQYIIPLVSGRIIF